MIAKVKTSAINGTEAIDVTVEVATAGGETSIFSIIGLGDNAVREARDRVISALTNSGFNLPSRILVNLAPAELKKEGSSFDLPIALGILISSGQLDADIIRQCKFYGELSLDGFIKRSGGILAALLEAKESGYRYAVVPKGNSSEASIVKGINIYPAYSLNKLVKDLKNEQLPILNVNLTFPESRYAMLKEKFLSEVKGQYLAKRALIIAAVGGHNMLMIGPPGCGKSMLAERLPFLLPPLNETEKLEVAKIYSLLNYPLHPILYGQRPFRSPHHIITDVGLVGGGTKIRPGEISLAHKGVLFLDEFPEFKRSALEALRAPLESKKVQISRAKATLTFPADFQLIAAMNPCPCGYLGTDQCTCTSTAVYNYLKKLSGPILDRIDIHIELENIKLKELLEHSSYNDQEVNDKLKAQIASLRQLQIKRQKKLNCHLEGKELFGQISSKGKEFLDKASKKKGLSSRGCVRVVRLARSIADFESADTIDTDHIAEALNFRALLRFKTD